MPETYRFTIFGAPRTKKTHNEVVRVRGRPVVMPSKQWRRWLRSAKLKLPDLFVTIRQNVNCRALFYRDASRGDAVGYYQGLADFLERYGQIKRDGRVLRAGLIYSDQQIVSWDGSRLLVDRERPRVEVELTIVSAHQMEVFRVEGA